MPDFKIFTPKDFIDALRHAGIHGQLSVEQKAKIEIKVSGLMLNALREEYKTPDGIFTIHGIIVTGLKHNDINRIMIWNGNTKINKRWRRPEAKPAEEPILYPFVAADFDRALEEARNNIPGAWKPEYFIAAEMCTLVRETWNIHASEFLVINSARIRPSDHLKPNQIRVYTDTVPADYWTWTRPESQTKSRPEEESSFKRAYDAFTNASPGTEIKTVKLKEKLLMPRSFDDPYSYHGLKEIKAAPEITYSCILQHPDGHEIVIPGPPKEDGWDWTHIEDCRTRAIHIAKTSMLKENHIRKEISYVLGGMDINQQRRIHFNHPNNMPIAFEYLIQAQIEHFRVLEWTKWEKVKAR